MDAAVACGGLPHSEIRASKGICPWARLIAACHVLLRLREPRHPSCALFSFPFFFSVFGVLPVRPPSCGSPVAFCVGICLYGRTSLRIYPQVALVCLDSLICSFNRSQLSSFRIQLPSIVASSMSMYSFFEWRITDSNR